MSRCVPLITFVNGNKIKGLKGVVFVMSKKDVSRDVSRSKLLILLYKLGFGTHGTLLFKKKIYNKVKRVAVYHIGGIGNIY